MNKKCKKYKNNVDICICDEYDNKCIAKNRKGEGLC